MGNALTLCIGLLPKNKFFEIIEPSREGSVKVSLLASHFRHILALLHLDIFTDRPWHLLADRVRHLNDSSVKILQIPNIQIEKVKLTTEQTSLDRVTHSVLGSCLR